MDKMLAHFDKMLAHFDKMLAHSDKMLAHANIYTSIVFLKNVSYTMVYVIRFLSLKNIYVNH